MLEHAIRLDLVQGSLEETLLIQILVIVISIRAELLSLLVEELEIGGALIRNVTVQSLLDLFLVPLDLAIPVVLLIIFKVIIEGKVGLLRSILTLCIRISPRTFGKNQLEYIRFNAAGRVWKSLVAPCNSLGQPCWTLTGTSPAFMVRSELIAAMDSFLSWTRRKLSMLENHMLKNLFVHPLASNT